MVLNWYGNDSYFATGDRFNSAVVFESHKEISEMESSLKNYELIL